MGPGGSGGSILNLTLWNGGTLNQGPALAIAAAGYYYPLNSTFNLTSFYQMQYFGGSSSYMMGNNCTAAKVYVIYLSAYNFASYNVPARFPSVAQASIIQNYIGGISSTPYWNVVKRYTGVTSIGAQKINVGNLGFNPATSVIKVACDGNAPTSATGWFNSPVKSCNSTKADVENIISAAITNIWLPNDLNGIYLVVGAPEVSHSLGPYLLGKDTCSYHAFFQSQSNALTYIYSYVAIPNFSSISTPYGTKGASQCFNANTRFSPNGDPQVDAAVNYINHEIIEAIIQPMPVQVRTWIDFNWQEGKQINMVASVQI